MRKHDIEAGIEAGQTFVAETAPSSPYLHQPVGTLEPTGQPGVWLMTCNNAMYKNTKLTVRSGQLVEPGSDHDRLLRENNARLDQEKEKRRAADEAKSLLRAGALADSQDGEEFLSKMLAEAKAERKKAKDAVLSLTKKDLDWRASDRLESLAYELSYARGYVEAVKDALEYFRHHGGWLGVAYRIMYLTSPGSPPLSDNEAESKGGRDAMRDLGWRALLFVMNMAADTYIPDIDVRGYDLVV